MMNNPLISLKNRRILLGITGGIAAYKAAELTRRLQDQGCDVRVIMTRSAVVNGPCAGLVSVSTLCPLTLYLNCGAQRTSHLEAQCIFR